MGLWAWLLRRNAKRNSYTVPSASSGGMSTSPAGSGEAAAAPEAPSSNRPGPGLSDKEIDRIAEMAMSWETAHSGDVFETIGKDIKSIVCSDDECPCTDQKQLLLGKDAYLYISPVVVDYRKDCLSLLELEIKVSLAKSPQDMLYATQNGMPKFVCEMGARRRGLDLAVALADGLAAARTGFVPLRPTPKRQSAKTEGERQDDKQTQLLATYLLSSERSTREGALVAARKLAIGGDRRGVDALEVAIRRKAGSDAIDFHTPSRLAVRADPVKARDTVLDIAKRGAILKQAKTVGSLFASLGLRDGEQARAFLAEIEEVGGEDQEQAFQLIATHLQAATALRQKGQG